MQSDLVDAFRKLCETTLDHPSLARPLAFGAEGDIPYVVYSELAGTAMDAVMRQHGVRPVAEVLQRAKQLADAIECAASAGVYHGMMAPCDVMLDGERTGVTGFGLAQALIKAGIPAEGVSPYGSPQRLAGAPPTPADDIYSLAAITLELLIGTPRDPDQDTARVRREAQGLPERRRLPRPAPHETRVFTTIPGVDAGKLRACFAAAFSEEPGERPSTAAEFVASFEDAFSTRRGTEEPIVAVAAVPVASDKPEEPPSAPALASKREEEQGSRETPVTSRPPSPKSPEHEARERKPEIRLVRPEPIDDVELLAEVTAARARSIERTAHAIPARTESRAFLVAAFVSVSFAAGFGGGFVVGHFSKPTTESTHTSDREPVAEPQPTRAAAEDPKPVASTTQALASMSEVKVSTPEPAAPTAAPQRAQPAAVSGRLLVRSRPAGAAVMVDGQSRGATPLALSDLAFGPHTIEVSHPGHDTRRRRVTLSERRPARSVDVELRRTSTPEPLAAATNSTGSLQVASRPAGAQVFVDDNLIGTTPLLLSDVTAGPKRLRIELSGYKSFETSVRIEPSGRSRVSATLEP